MNEAQQKAWNCLTTVEQNSLFLQLTQGKSSWEAGEILKLSHYKYLEIKDRSQKFFRMFGDFFELHPDLFRPDNPCEENFIDYIYACIEQRLKRSQAIHFCGDSSNQLPEVNSKNIIRNMERLKNSGDEWDHHLRNLILEFDRWNNYRILPRILQQPSAFKRRVNKKHKIYIKYLLHKIPQFVHLKLKERFHYKTRPNKEKYWVALISRDLYEDDGYYLLPVRPLREVVEEMNKFYIYVFSTREDADNFGFLVSKFINKTKGVKLGQTFWPEYKEVISRAINFNEVNNIDFQVKQLDNAYSISKSKKNKKPKEAKPGLERASTSTFYPKN
jgi:hypothetical protein